MTSSPKTWHPLDLAKTSSAYLAGKGVENAQLDAEILLAHVLGCKRVELYARFEQPLEPDEVNRYRELIRRRAAREPVSRILGEKEFMSLPFRVTPEVLSPRPETEILVEEAVKLLGGSVQGLGKPKKKRPDPDGSSDDTADTPAVEAEATHPRVLDMGTGSGCIAVGIAAFCPDARIVATDLSRHALLIARENADVNQVWERIDFREGDWFEALHEGERFDLIVSNPPYVVENDPALMPEVRDFDPPLSLFGGKDGLEAYRTLARDLDLWLNPGAFCLFECGEGQACAVHDLLAAAGLADIRTLRDYAGIERVAVARKPRE